MMPKSKLARIVFIVILVITGILLVTSIGTTIWSQVGEEGWVSKAVMALVSWCVTAPFIVASGVWTLVLALKKRNSDVAVTSPESHH